MNRDLTQGPVVRTMLLFAVPMIVGNLLQQCYNIADTMIVGKYLGQNALAAVGSAFTLMTFLTSILLGLCMGSGAVFSIRFGQQEEQKLQESVAASFALIAALTVLLNTAAFLLLDQVQVFLRVPQEVWGIMREYLAVIFCGIAACFLYNYFASFLRAIGNSVAPLLFLAVSAVLNIGLDFWFVLGFQWGAAGAALATVLSQYVSGLGIMLYAMTRYPQVRSAFRRCRISRACVREIAGFSVLTCVQQSVMNLGILLVQGLVNSFGPVVMAAFAAAVKIDAFAYMPVQDFGNAFSTFIAQNYGAKKRARIQAGLKGAALTTIVFSAAVSGIVWLFARQLMGLFVGGSDPAVAAVIQEGVQYLQIEGVFYFGIGGLFLLYGLYRALGKPGMSVVLTVISLGTRVALAYALSAVPSIGVMGIWWSVPIGWLLADTTGLVYYLRRKSQLLFWDSPA